MLHHHFMHVDNELVEFVPAGEQVYEEIIEEYEEEILIQEGAPEPSVADFVDIPPAQGKPQCITPYFNNHYLYMLCVFTLQESYGNHMHKYICPKNLTSAGLSSCST